MTVGVAVIARNGSIVGGADRAIRWGDNLQVQPDQSKILHFNNCHVSVLWAGSATVASETLTAIARPLQAQGKHLTVEVVAHAAADFIATLFGMIAEREYLTPLQLTVAELLSPDCPVPPEERTRLLDKVAAWEPSEAHAIHLLFVGYDPDGFPRIYRVVNRAVSDHSMIGFAAIGSGATYAEEALIRRGFTREGSPQWEAVLLAYLAKVEAEDSPAVGAKSNFFAREPRTRFWVRVPAKVVRVLDRAYRALKRGERDVLKRVASETSDKLMRLMLTPAEIAKQPRPKSHLASGV